MPYGPNSNDITQPLDAPQPRVVSRNGTYESRERGRKRRLPLGLWTSPCSTRCPHCLGPLERSARHYPRQVRIAEQRVE